MTNSIEIEMGDDADAEASDAVICVRLTSPLLLPDNEIGLCSECGEAIQYRPHAPKRPPKICSECLVSFVKDETATIVTTPTIIAEVAAQLRKKNAN